MNKPLYATFIIIAIITVLFFPVLIHTSAITGNYGDIYQHYYPMKYLVSEHIISGRMPLWNPYIFTGQPLLANPQSSIFYPLSVFFYILPITNAFVYFQYLHFVMAGIFMFILLKYYKYSDSASITCAVVLCLSSFMIYKIPSGHPMALSGYVWLPLVALLAESLLQNPGNNNVIILSSTLIFQFLSGHTFPLFNSIIFLIVFMLFYFPKSYKYYLGSFVLVALVSAIQLLPSFELSRASENSNLLGLVNSYSLPLKNLVTFIMPGYFGNIINKTFIFNSHPSYFFEKYCLYIGILPFVFALTGLFLSLKTRKYFYPLLFACGLAFAIGFQNPVFALFYKYMPGFDFLRVPARFIYLSIFSLTVLCAYFMNRMLREKWWGIKLTVFLIVFVDLFIWGHKFIYAEPMSNYKNRVDLTGSIDPSYRIITEPDMIISNKSMLYHHFNLNGYEAIFLKDFTRYLGLQEKQALNSTGLCRTDLSSPLSKAFSVRYLITPVVHNDLKSVVAVNDKLNIYAYTDALPKMYFAGSLKTLNSNDIAGQFNYLSSTRLTPDKELLLTEDSYPQDYMRFTNIGKLLSINYFEDKITAELVLQQPATLVLSDVFYSGWKAASGSKKFIIMRGQKVFRAVFLPAGVYKGNKKLVFYYQPISFHLGLLLTLFSVTIIAAYYASIGLKRETL